MLLAVPYLYNLPCRILLQFEPKNNGMEAKKNPISDPNLQKLNPSPQRKVAKIHQSPNGSRWYWSDSALGLECNLHDCYLWLCGAQERRSIFCLDCVWATQELSQRTGH